MYVFLDYCLFGFHLLLVAFNLFGWIWHKTRRLHPDRHPFDHAIVVCAGALVRHWLLPIHRLALAGKSDNSARKTFPDRTSSTISTAFTRMD